MTVPSPTKHMRDLCKELGPKYDIRVIDLENVIYRNLGNGFDVEISGMDTSSLKKRATIYLWSKGGGILKIIEDVPQSNIGDIVEELNYLSKKLDPNGQYPELRESNTKQSLTRNLQKY